VKQRRIVIAGAGVAGCLIASGLADRPDLEVIILERSPVGAQLDVGTGLNIGPNALKVLAEILPERANAVRRASLPWHNWQVGLTDGRILMDLDLADVADNPGVRIRWSSLYALLRAPISDCIRFGVEVVGVNRTATGIHVETIEAATGVRRRIDDVDLIIAGDGRYSDVRRTLCGEDPPDFFGVALFRTLLSVNSDCPINDYGQWFNGPNRLLAFRVPGDLVYCAGSFPIGHDAQVTDQMKSRKVLAELYRPKDQPLSDQAKFLVDALLRPDCDLHWARLQDGPIRHDGGPGVVFVGDAAHPILPTLGQGATQAIEDACELIDELRHSLTTGDDLCGIPRRFAVRRDERAQFVRQFSRDATDTMLRNSDPIAGTALKQKVDFTSRLQTLYRYAPEWIT